MTSNATDALAVAAGLACPACGASDHSHLEHVDMAGQHELYTSNPEMQRQLNESIDPAAREMQICRCASCGLEFADPMLAPSAEWYRLAYQAQDLYPTSRWEFDAVLRHVAPQSRILELGCGTGSFLKLCRERNIAAVGVDFAVDAIAECRRAGLDARVLDVCENAFQPGEKTPDHITAFHVLEHLDRPIALFEQARSNAGSNTNFWIAVPSDRRGSRWLGERDFLDQPPHHMTRWTERALRAIGQRAGWSLQDVTFEPLDRHSAMWTLATGTKLYRGMLARGMRYQSFKERLLRWSLIPWATCQRMGPARELSGFTMLGRFTRV